MKISFSGIPKKYIKIDNFVSRSAQPQKEDFVWLKEQGITDVINFRTKPNYGIDFNEEKEVKKLGMEFHNIPSYTRHPSLENIKLFLNTIDKIIQKNGKAHIHCKAGVDRTGMYAFSYKENKHLGETQDNIKEWIILGHHIELFPHLINDTLELLKKMKSDK